jgi:hypothetical protein
VRATTPIFFQKAEELRDRWDALLSEEKPKTFFPASSPAVLSAKKPVPVESPSAQAVLDIMHWTSRATFDIIGLAGFDYHFHALQDESEDVYLAYRRMFNVADKGANLKGLLRIYFPFIEKLLVSLGFIGFRSINPDSA